MISKDVILKYFVAPLFGALLTAVPLRATADERTLGSQPLFVCEAEHDGIIELRAVEQDDGTWADLQFYGFGDGLAPVRFPLSPAAGKTSFFFSNYEITKGYSVNVRFQIGQVRYRLYSLTFPANEDGITGVEGGLEFTLADGRPGRIICDESPYMFISYMRAAMSCDLDNPFGAAGCDPGNVPGGEPDD